ncbi:DUF1905 domain-containing protein [Cellulomonas algicola]|uniref:DUF1905 domain-containing protein n=1 Tax=Cellulomonas algicola TaxID=2071633 RepID=A0A401V1X8_9CELL|nr:DUF1905 domain-containing protein [Cellulomonas algicola]GCD20905.1 hypothetical protein CTKZ_24670 [Cellulomonas algicola]
MTDRPTYEFDAPLWRWDARKTDSWVFVSLPTDIADDVLEVSSGVTRGFGSVRVEVTLGGSVWRTSVFPDDKAKTYVLPLKKAVRRAESCDVGDTVRLRVALVDVGSD